MKGVDFSEISPTPFITKKERIQNMVGVTLKKNQSIDSALRYFKKKVLINGVLKDIKRTLYYEKPSVKKKRKKAEGISRFKKQLREEV